MITKTCSLCIRRSTRSEEMVSLLLASLPELARPGWRPVPYLSRFCSMAVAYVGRACLLSMAL